MKIIAHSGSDKVFIEASRDEVARLVGFYSAYDEKFRAAMKDLPVGTEIKISEMYDRLGQQNYNTEKMLSTARELRGMAESLEILQPIVFPKIEPNEKKV